MTNFNSLPEDLQTAPVKALIDVAYKWLNNANTETNEAWDHFNRAKQMRGAFLETVEALRALGVTFDIDEHYARGLEALRQLEGADG